MPCNGLLDRQVTLSLQERLECNYSKTLVTAERKITIVFMPSVLPSPDIAWIQRLRADLVLEALFLSVSALSDRNTLRKAQCKFVKLSSSQFDVFTVETAR